MSPRWCMDTEWLSTLVFSHVCEALDWENMERFQGFLAEATNVCIVQGNLSAKHSFQSGLWIWELVMFWEEKKNTDFSHSPITYGSHPDNNRLLINPLAPSSGSLLTEYLLPAVSSWSFLPIYSFSILKGQNQCLLPSGRLPEPTCFIGHSANLAFNWYLLLLSVNSLSFSTRTFHRPSEPFTGILHSWANRRLSICTDWINEWINKWMASKTKRYSIRATEDVRTDVSIISSTKSSDHSIRCYLIHLRGQIVPSLQEKTVSLRKERSKVITGSHQESHWNDEIQVSWNKACFLERLITTASKVNSRGRQRVWVRLTSLQ